MSPTDLTQAYLTRFDKLDSELTAGKRRGPLHGIPLALKDLIDTAAIATAGGAKVYADRIPTADATVARRLADAGAVLLGINMHELALGVTTTNPHIGATHNPFDTTRIPGCSGAATAAHLAASTIGSDTAGSVRIPASFCGCVGLKPTYGRVSAAGVMPLTRLVDHVGPLDRTVEDAAIILGAVAGYDPADAVTVPMSVPESVHSASIVTGRRSNCVPQRSTPGTRQPSRIRHAAPWTTSSAELLASRRGSAASKP